MPAGAFPQRVAFKTVALVYSRRWHQAPSSRVKVGLARLQPLAFSFALWTCPFDCFIPPKVGHRKKYVGQFPLIRDKSSSSWLLSRWKVSMWKVPPIPSRDCRALFFFEKELACVVPSPWQSALKFSVFSSPLISDSHLF